MGGEARHRRRTASRGTVSRVGVCSRCLGGLVRHFAPQAALAHKALNLVEAAYLPAQRTCSSGDCRLMKDWVAYRAGSAHRKAQEPAYPLGPHSVSPLRRLAGGCAPSDPRTGNGAR